MPMKPCQKCLNNNWDFKKNDDTIEATCQMCGYEVSFSALKKKPKPSPTICKGCNNKLDLIRSRFKPSKLKKPYYFTHSLHCSKCNKWYISNEHKVINENNKLF